MKRGATHSQTSTAIDRPDFKTGSSEGRLPGQTSFDSEVMDESNDAHQARPAVEMGNVYFTYDGAASPALKGVDLTLRSGEMVGIVGASGAGKSTLAKCLNRLVPAFERGKFDGIVRIHGRDLAGACVSDLAPLVGMVFQDFEAQLFSTNVALEIAFTMQQVGMPREEIAARIEPALAAVGLSGFAHRDPTSLSGGEKQRLAIAAVLALRPRLIVLDEPTTDLDPEGKAEVFSLIRKLREQGLSLIIIEHEAEELRECDRLLVLSDGQIIAQGPPASIMTQFELLESCGVHPPDLNRALAMLDIRTHAASVDQAEELIRRASREPGNSTGELGTDGGTIRHASATIATLIDSSVTRPYPGIAGGAPHCQTHQDEAAGTGGPRLVERGPDLGQTRSETSLQSGDCSSQTAASPSDARSASFAFPLAEAQQLYFSYPLGPRVLDAVNFQINPGEFLAIVGQNGSGKTTFAKHLVGLLTPSEGTVLLEGRDRRSLSPAETAHQVGYVFQNPDHQIFASTVEAEIAFGPRNFGLEEEETEQRTAEVLQAVNLENARKRDPFLLSKGERQRLAVASVLALRPRLLILDEPTTGLDYREQRRMMALVSDLNRTGIAITIITHTPWLVAEYARRVVLMRRGRILFDGPVDSFFQQEELLGESSFRPPEITRLARRFGLMALSPEQFASTIRTAVKR